MSQSPHQSPMPAVAADCVAIAFATQNGPRRHKVKLVLVDKSSGRLMDTHLLSDPFGVSSRLSLRGLGEALFVVGGGSSTKGQRIERLEKMR